jgi:hypothetical protein
MDAVDPCPLDAENACDEVAPPGDPEERCRPFDVSWRAAFGAGSDQMEYGVSGSWCTDGTNLRVVGSPQTYGEILTPALLAALGSVFDLHFRYTNEHPVVGIETFGDSITLTADGTFELCGSVIPFGSALVEIPALKGLAKALEHAPAAVRRKITPLIAAAITKWFAITGRAFGLTKAEADSIKEVISMILDEALQKVGSIFSPTCLPAWQPEITVSLSARGTAAAWMNDFGSLFTTRQSSSVGIP